MFSDIINKVLSRQVDYSEELRVLEYYIKWLLELNARLSHLAPFAHHKGKRIRSILYFTNWEKFSSVSRETKYKTIALIELIHFASLLHDDVIDNNMTRRNASSFVQKYGHKSSIVFGDVLFVKVIDEFLKLHDNNNLVKNFCLKACASTAYGALLERHLTIDSSFQECLKMSALKTSSLFELSCFLGAYLSSNDFQKAKASAIAGLCFGILFQFHNDIKDYSAPSFEKSEDFMQKNITMPLLLLRDFFQFDLSKFNSTNQPTYDEIKKLMHTPEFQVYAFDVLSKYHKRITSLPGF